MNINNTAIVVAAGKSTRYGGNIPKILLDLGGKPLLYHSLDVLEKSPLIEQIILVTSYDLIDTCEKEIIIPGKFKKIEAVIAGGKERQDSVKEGLKTIYKPIQNVLIHDGARPFLTQTMIKEVLCALTTVEGTVIGTKISDTIKEVDANLMIHHTVPRDMLWAVQTPQAFQYSVLMQAYQWAFDIGMQFTDDAGLVEKFGKKVQLIEGSSLNIKITTPEDLIMANQIYNYLQNNPSEGNS